MRLISKISLWAAFAMTTLSGQGHSPFAHNSAKAAKPNTTLTFDSFMQPSGTPIVEIKSEVDQYISDLYNTIRFGGNRLSYGVFSEAMHGYLNLRNAGKLGSEKEILSICDFNLASTKPRLWVIDLANKKILFNTLVAHGEGSGKLYARKFSNKDNSHQSSTGFYVTKPGTYKGKHGLSLRMVGLDKGFNDAAFSRAIVVHGADYVSEKYIKKKGYLGQSWGCPAVSTKLAKPIINVIKGSTCLFISYNNPKYLLTSKWLKKKSTVLPADIQAIAADKPTVSSAPKAGK